MRISRLVLNNYRQFEKTEIVLEKSLKQDIHIIVGTNGTGKTNILNAINWCLYNDEPHLSKESEGLPIPNISSLELAKIGDDIPISVELWLECDNDQSLCFSRKARYKKVDSNITVRQSVDFEVSYIDEKNNRKAARDEEAIGWVERTFPIGIREFFFFDGERLDRYFREATGQKIKNAIFKISQIDLMQELERKIQIIKNDFTSDASRTNPQIELRSKELNDIDNAIKDIGSQIEECNNQISIATQKINEYNEKLMGVPNIEKIEEERTLLRTTQAGKIKAKKEKEIQKETLLSEYGRYVMLWPAIEKAISIVNEKAKNKEIPPTIDKTLIENILQNDVCSICNRPLSMVAKDYIKSLYSSLGVSSKVASQLVQMNTCLNQIQESRQDFKNRIYILGVDINGLEDELTQINLRLNEIGNLVEGFNQNEIAESYRDRDRFERTLIQSHERLGMLRSQLETKKDDKDQKEKELSYELSKVKKIEGINKKIQFCTRSLEVIRRSTQDIMQETRERIEDKTIEHFFNLIWKKDTFSKVEIEDDYSIKLIHSLGYSCLGTVSAGERGLLALAFTLALHDTSGFDSPILIDTPVARISDRQREKFAEVLSQVGFNKQVLLLFTPSEYSQEISQLMDKVATTRYKFTLSNERTVRMELL
jgi:DNA sulfur modification protein DndD